MCGTHKFTHAHTNNESNTQYHDELEGSNGKGGRGTLFMLLKHIGVKKNYASYTHKILTDRMSKKLMKFVITENNEANGIVK